MNEVLQTKLCLTTGTGEAFRLPIDKTRKRYKDPSYRKIDRIDKKELNYRTLRELYVQIANYCPRPLNFGGEVAPKIEVSDTITLWCTEYSMADDYAIDQEPSVYYEAEINNTWKLTLKEKIYFHSYLLDLLRAGFSFEDIDQKLQPIIDKFQKKKQVDPIFKGLQ